MNQKTLSIAIVVVAALVIVMGLWLSGAGQTGPLSGDVSYYCCSEFPELKAYCYIGVIPTDIWGTLKTSSGAPLPNQVLEVWYYEKSSETWRYWFSTTTGADGSFKAEKATVSFYDPMVVYKGCEYNGIPYCDKSVICTHQAGTKL